jgi:hypothetical protein
VISNEVLSVLYRELVVTEGGGPIDERQIPRTGPTDLFTIDVAV